MRASSFCIGCALHVHFSFEFRAHLRLACRDDAWSVLCTELARGAKRQFFFAIVVSLPYTSSLGIRQMGSVSNTDLLTVADDEMGSGRTAAVCG